MSSRPSTTLREAHSMVDLLALVIYLACLGALMWLHYRKVTRLEAEVEQQRRVIAGLGIALVKHLTGEDVQVEIIPLRLNEEE